MKNKRHRDGVDSSFRVPSEVSQAHGFSAQELLPLLGILDRHFQGPLAPSHHLRALQDNGLLQRFLQMAPAAVPWTQHILCRHPDTLEDHFMLPVAGQILQRCTAYAF
jgi:hypothetical protein